MSISVQKDMFMALNEKEERQSEFDIMKGVGILLVMFGHLFHFYGCYVLPQWLDLAIYSFHVPMFFIISGYFSSTFNGDCRKIISKYFKRLVVPYIVTSVIVICYYVGLSWKRNDWDLLLTIIRAQLTLEQGIGINPIWFLLALFWAKVLFLFMSKYGKFSFVICFILSWAASFVEIPLPFMLKQGLTALGFVAAGYWCRNHAIPIWLGIVSILCYVLSQVFHLRIAPYAGNYPFYPINFFSASGGTLLMYYIAKLLKKSSLIERQLSLIGCNSMNVLCVHTIDMRCNIIRIILKHISCFTFVPWLGTIIEYFAVLFISFILIRYKRLMMKYRKYDFQ